MLLEETEGVAPAAVAAVFVGGGAFGRAGRGPFPRWRPRGRRRPLPSGGLCPVRSAHSGPGCGGAAGLWAGGSPDGPELHQAAALYRALKAGPSAALFQELRQVTADYAVPEDACQAYAKTYGLLARLDEDFSR